MQHHCPTQTQTDNPNGDLNVWSWTPAVLNGQCPRQIKIPQSLRSKVMLSISIFVEHILEAITISAGHEIWVEYKIIPCPDVC